MKIFAVFTRNGRVDFPVKDSQAAMAAEIVKNPLPDITEKLRQMNDLSNKLTKAELKALGNAFEKFEFTDVDGKKITIEKGGPGSGCQGENCGRPSEGKDKPVKHTPSTIKNALEANGVHPDSVGKNKNGNIVARRGFYYRFDNNADKWKDSVSNALNNAGVKHTIVDHGEHWAPFRGGATTAQGSHWYAEIKPTEAPGMGDKDYEGARAAGMGHEEATRFAAAAKRPETFGGRPNMPTSGTSEVTEQQTHGDAVREKSRQFFGSLKPEEKSDYDKLSGGGQSSYASARTAGKSHEDAMGDAKAREEFTGKSPSADKSDEGISGIKDEKIGDKTYRTGTHAGTGKQVIQDPQSKEWNWRDNTDVDQKANGQRISEALSEKVRLQGERAKSRGAQKSVDGLRDIVGTIQKGGSGSGNYDGPGAPRFKTGDQVRINVAAGQPIGTVVKPISNDVMEVEYKAPSSGIVRTDRYYADNLQHVGKPADFEIKPEDDKKYLNLPKGQYHVIGDSSKLPNPAGKGAYSHLSVQHDSGSIHAIPKSNAQVIGLVGASGSEQAGKARGGPSAQFKPSPSFDGSFQQRQNAGTLPHQGEPGKTPLPSKDKAEAPIVTTPGPAEATGHDSKKLRNTIIAQNYARLNVPNKDKESVDEYINSPGFHSDVQRHGDIQDKEIAQGGYARGPHPAVRAVDGFIGKVR